MKILLAALGLIWSVQSLAQSPKNIFNVTIKNDSGQLLSNVNVQLLNIDSTVYKSKVSDASGKAQFTLMDEGSYILEASHAGLQKVYQHFDFPDQPVMELIINSDAIELQSVTVSTQRPFASFLPDKTVINPEASINNAGSTVMDVLEKSPGITINRDGSIILKGKPSVMVLIDDKPTQLSGADLQTFLSGMSSAQVDVIELIENPGARYDAAGNAGIINIKTKKIKQRGFNGSLSLSLGQGIYTKNNNSLNLNYRNGKFNLYLNYSNRIGGEMTEITAMRKYFDKNGNDSLYLDQPNRTNMTLLAHNVKAGIDFFVSNSTTIGLGATGYQLDRNGDMTSLITWMQPDFTVDSTIKTWGYRNNEFRRGGINFNVKQVINKQSDITADAEFLKFEMDDEQDFQTQFQLPGSLIYRTRGILPSRLDIMAIKVDYTLHSKSGRWESGLKTARTNADNLVTYRVNNGSGWQDDYGRSNHFLYDEKIHAAYTSWSVEKEKWQWQTGLRYELTSYDAHQLGNVVVKDSAFERRYGNIFPTAFITHVLDSNHNLTFRLGRRIDRPPFHTLNPFFRVLNKYTYEGGNPFIVPQYTWNLELVHTFKEKFSTTVSYSYLNDYFSQIFVIDSNASNVNKNVIIYTRGNVGKFQNIGLSVSLQETLNDWWDLTSTVVYNHKIIEGFVWKPMKVSVNQVNISLNNQFHLQKGWALELSGYYLSPSRIDLQESLTPQGQINFGLSKQIFKNKGTLRFTMQDIFYTQNYSGYSNFENSDEPFTVKWDSRVARISFNWRFGKVMKSIGRRESGASEEVERVGTGN